MAIIGDPNTCFQCGKPATASFLNYSRNSKLLMWACDEHNPYPPKSIKEIMNQLAAQVATLVKDKNALQEWRDSVSSAIKTEPAFMAGKWVGDKEGWGYHLVIVCRLVREHARLNKLAAGVAQLREVLGRSTMAAPYMIYEAHGMHIPAEDASDLAAAWLEIEAALVALE